MTEQYASPILAAQDKIDNLNDLVSTLERESDSYQHQLAQANKMSTMRVDTINDLAVRINKAEKYVVGLVDDGDIEEEYFLGIASIFEWEATKEIDVTVTAVFSGTITVPRGFETDYLDENFNVECSPHGDIEGYLEFDSLDVEVSN